MMNGLRRAAHWRFGVVGSVAAAGTAQGGSNQTRSSCTAQQAKQLHHIVVLHRHGDRAPVTRSIGPKYPHSLEVQNLWQEKLISGHNLELMKLIAKAQSHDNNDDIYTGRDIASIPYGQLTDKGSSQLIDLGRTLRDIYVDQHKFLPAQLTGDMIYARSSSMCRTINSLRSLLVGLYGFSTPDDIARRFADDVSLNSTTSSTFPIIRSYPVGSDPLIDGPCEDPEFKNTLRREVLESHNIPHGYPHGYQAMEEKMRECLGFEMDQRVNWLVIREQLVCMQEHDLAFPEGLDASVMDQLYGLELWICKKLFGHPTYNALAIGAFYRELRDRLLLIQTGAATEQISIYSAHDYTLIPFMEGLGILPQTFPHYAAYIVMEIATIPSSTSSNTAATSPTSPVALSTTASAVNDPNNANPTTETILTAKTTEIAPLHIRFLYNGNEIIFPGHDHAWMTLQDVNNKLLHCATHPPISTSATEKEDTSTATTVPGTLPLPPSTRSKL